MSKLNSTKRYNDLYQNRPWGISWTQSKNKKESIVTEEERTTIKRQTEASPQRCTECKEAVPLSGSNKLCHDCDPNIIINPVNSVGASYYAHD